MNMTISLYVYMYVLKEVSGTAHFRPLLTHTHKDTQAHRVRIRVCAGMYVYVCVGRELECGREGLQNGVFIFL